MKKYLVIVLTVLLTNNMLAQGDFKTTYLHELSVNYGVMPFLNRTYEPFLESKIFSIENANYYTNNLGFRTGIAIITDMEGVNSQFCVPIYFSYRTKERNDFVFADQSDAFSSLLSSIYFFLFPRKFEFNIGTSVGYINPDNGISYSVIDDKRYIINYEVDNKFYNSIDLGVKMIYKIQRVGIDLSATYCYLTTNNYKFKSELPFATNNGFQPKNFIKLQVGLSYSF